MRLKEDLWRWGPLTTPGDLYMDWQEMGDVVDPWGSQNFTLFGVDPTRTGR